MSHDALRNRLASILIDLTDDAEPRPSDTDIASAINDAIIALSRRAVPMEAVAWTSQGILDDIKAGSYDTGWIWPTYDECHPLALALIPQAEET